MKTLPHPALVLVLVLLAVPSASALERTTASGAWRNDVNGAGSVAVRTAVSHSTLMDTGPFPVRFGGGSVISSVPVRAAHRVHERRGYRRHVHRRECGRVEGAHQRQRRQVWVAGYRTRQWVAPAYVIRILNGRYHQVLLQEGYFTIVLIPGHYEWTTVSVWVPGRWRCGY